jgi:hypothetical protein
MHEQTANPRFQTIDNVLPTLERTISEHLPACTRGELEQVYDRLQTLVTEVSVVLIGREVRSDS